MIKRKYFSPIFTLQEWTQEKCGLIKKNITGTEGTVMVLNFPSFQNTEVNILNENTESTEQHEREARRENVLSYLFTSVGMNRALCFYSVITEYQ